MIKHPPTKLFIRGGQTFLHNVRMFTQVAKKVTLSLFLFIPVFFCLLFYCQTNSYQRHILTEYFRAEGLLLIESRPKQTIRMENGNLVSVYSADFARSTLVLNILNKSKKQAFYSLYEACMASLLMMLFIIKWLQKRGENQGKSRIVRGSSLAESSLLNKQIKKTGAISPYSIGGIQLPKDSETQHIQLAGTTGSGKTVAIRELLTTIRERGERAIIYDKGGTYLSRFYRENQDVLLNPLDTRGKAWNVWAECEDKADFDALAEALMPMPINNTMDPFWINAARMIFASTAYELRNDPARSNLTLLQYLLTADLGSIHKLLRHTESESLVSEKVQKTALNVKTVMATYLKSLLYLQDKGETFSIRNWILEEQRGSCLFVSSDGRKHPTLRPLITAWINTAAKELLSLSPDDNRRVWFILDELATLHMLPFLETVKSESRKFGGCFVVGHHGNAQLRKIYGPDGAANLSNLCSTRLYLRMPEHVNALNASDNIGTYEIEEVNESISYGANTMRDGISVSRQTREKRLVLPSEIQELPDLKGYLRVKGEFPATKINLEYVHYPTIHSEFIQRETDPDPLRQKIEKLVDQYSDPLLATSHDEAMETIAKESSQKETISFL